ncbi:hypothetical protein LVJ94_03135 [Pendulispora rubella]|uniref:Glycoside hydrolase n=1 Tax=Pendulispora rubella TaxID=2741070 RepID=A0ABZ2LAM1_9BACT
MTVLFLALTNQRAAADGPIPIMLGASVVPLHGPWRFHTGDDPRWADPDFDDSDWENVDLTPAPGAHDADVGLSGYVPGWRARGHSGHWGYAWYRMRISVAAPPGYPLALAGPPYVDEAYQVFLDGKLLGSSGTFSSAAPVVYSIQPRLFSLPALQARTVVLAFRVWMGEDAMLAADDTGGIHIAPVIGEASGVEARYRLQWWETICGYVVDAVEPLVFVLLAGVSLIVFAFARTNRAYLWLSGALLLTALLRVHQVIFFWTHWESTHDFDLVREISLVPLVLAAWVMAWRAWFDVLEARWLPRATGALALMLAVLQAAGRAWLAPFLRDVRNVTWVATEATRCAFLALIVFITYTGIRRHGREAWLALPAVILVSVALFADELSLLRVPGIWFPFGTGVSRTQFALAGFDVAIAFLLLRRLLLHAHRTTGAVASHAAGVRP